MTKGLGPVASTDRGYNAVLADVVRLVHEARRAAARSVNAVMTTVYWESGAGSSNGSKGARDGPRTVKRFSRGWRWT